MVKKAIIFFFLWLGLRFVLALLAKHVFPLVEDFIIDEEFRRNLPYLIWIWGNFDGYHYLHIAAHNYGLYQNPFFPLYPYAIHFMSVTEPFNHYPLLVIGEIISNVSLFLAFLLISKLLTMDGFGKNATLFFLIFILFPSTFFYGAVYNDSLFFFFACLTIYLARRRFWLLSSIAGMFATLTRLNGLALFFLIFAEYLTSYSKKAQNVWTIAGFKKAFRESLVPVKVLKSQILSIFLIPAAFFGYLYYTQAEYGDWHLIFRSMKIWGQDKVVFPLQVFWRYFKIIFIYPNFKITYWIAIIELISVLFLIYILYISFKKIRLSYWLFFFLSILIPSLTGTFQGMPRYGLHIYPFFLGILIFLKDKRLFVKSLYFTISLILLILFISLFTRGYFIAQEYGHTEKSYNLLSFVKRRQDPALFSL